MRGHAHLVGSYRPGSSPLHRMPLRTKLPLLLGLGTVSLAVQGMLPRTLLLLAVLILHFAAGAGWRRLLSPLKPMWLFLLVLAAYHWWQHGPGSAWQILAGLLACVYAANILLATTPVQCLLDALVAAVRPLQRFGADPERFALAIGLMLRSIPFLVGSFADVREAAKARGLERNPRALVMPALIGTVAYARQTGDALAARGLGDKDDGGQQAEKG
ncbi:energy-coupling factor transporter transmembrane component T family protein [Arthrobacter mobilis]|uniref:Energy-coupling factor transporter transmembrane protein EcfT n=1 Tax=Arthrobacter mobilis TaxID=2724944 RepID=A0A7X6HB74_9MICC|nr:energy-coupling factor transporter transmembrane protein EcfT [Arthrobacter mobilis]NKX53878.1 energy-coupling factor transporter transmembrane protein EcfT [Arthrobacter mobilis]